MTRTIASLVAFAWCATSAAAQTIRGTVVDDASKLPLAAVLVSMLDETGTEIASGARSDDVGNFVIHAPKAGTWRVKAVRIGYSPITSSNVSLAVGELAVVRLRMTTVAQQLVPVVVVERRHLNANELMSTVGFDLRKSRGLGQFMSGERLASMQRDGAREVLANQFLPTLFVLNDPAMGDVLRMRQGASTCAPEMFLDGRLLATAPRPHATLHTGVSFTAIDSLRSQMRIEAESARLGFDQMNALNVLSSYTAEMLHGIEVYRSYEVPPASLGGWFGMTKSSVGACGTVAVWTKAGAQSVVAARRAIASGRAVQVVMGTLLDYESSAPLAGREVTLLTESSNEIGSPTVTDARGEFTIRTDRGGNFRLTAGGAGYFQSTTVPFTIAANELLLVKLFVSAREGVLTPLAVSARVLPQDIGASSLAGFTYRRERAQGGSFLNANDIARTDARTVADVLKNVEGVSIVNSPTSRGVVAVVRGRGAQGAAPNCAPVYFLDGVAVAGNMPASIASLAVDRIFGVEVYVNTKEIPAAFTDAGACGLIVVWTRR